MKRLVGGFVAAVVLGLGGLSASQDRWSVLVIPTAQRGVAISEARVYTNEHAMPALDLTLTGQALDLRLIRVTTFYLAANGHPLGSESRTVVPPGLGETRAIQLQLSGHLVDPGIQVKVAVSQLVTSAAAWSADRVALAKTATSAAAPTEVAGSWSPIAPGVPPQGGRVGTAEAACNRDFCVEERIACMAMCGRVGVRQFDCTIGASCSSSCVCNYQ